MDEVVSLRKRIDAIDSAIAALVAARAETVEHIRAVKLREGLPPVDESRESIVVSRLEASLLGIAEPALVARKLADVLLRRGTV